ncbi:MobF family relaxase [Geoanaerobacter pelophilus]|nr:MobF family relaxase [Geoanaerobacter pelophilus]
MMSVSPGMAAGQAGGYFSQEDYYLRGDDLGENSLWLGRGSRELGLEGPVREEEFRALCRGEDPEGNLIVAPKLTRDPHSGLLVETHRAGNDCTFSAPKSVSIAYAAGVDGVREAHDAAVLSVVGHMEEHYSHYRSPEGVRNGGMVAAKFDHATSRNIDPQLHSHVFVVNAVRTGDGSWRANEPKAIFQDQKSLGLLYRQALAHELIERGFEVEIRDRSQMFIELKGIDPRLVEHFSSRRLAIEEQVERWRSEGHFIGVPHARLYEMAALESRDPKRSITKEEVTRIFERGFEECGSSVQKVRLELEESRERALSVPRPEVEPPRRVLEAAVRDLAEREAVLDRARVLDQAVRVSGGGHTLSELNAALDGGTPGLVRLGQDARGRELYTTAEMQELERRNLDRIRELAPFRSVTTKAELERYLERLSEEGVRLTAGQTAEVFNELTGSRGAALSMGDPGTAKTSTLKVIERFNEEVLVPEGQEHLSVNLAYTGKAARELSLATGRPACTLSSFEKANPASKFALQRQNGEPAMVMVAGEKILIPDQGGREVVFRVDEAGFLGARQAEHLLEVVEELQQRGLQVKLHLLGDSKQMQGIQAGDLLKQVRELGLRQEVDYAHLDEILRQRDPGLLEIARTLNREDRPLAENARKALSELEKRCELREFSNLEDLRREVMQHYLEESRKPSLLPERERNGDTQQVLLVTSTNAQRKELNSEIRAARVAAGEIEEGKSFTVLSPVRQELTVEGYQLGDTVLFSGEPAGNGRMINWGARLQTEGQVVKLDRGQNRVTVSYLFAGKGPDGEKELREVSKEFSAADLAGRTTLFRKEERRFSVGDRIVALKNDAKLDLQNGALGVIRELDDKGAMLVDLGDRQVRLDLEKYRQLDHAYAVTIHKSQGSTVEHSIMYAPVRPGKGPEKEIDGAAEEYGRTSYNALNVAVTRARFGTRVFTNSIEGLTRSVETVDGKTSTLAKVREPKRNISPVLLEKIEGRPGPGLSLKIENLQRVMLRPEAGVRKMPSLEHVVPMLRVPGHKLPAPVREIPSLQKTVGRQLELSLPKGFGMDLEK